MYAIAFEPIKNSADWQEFIEVLSDDDGTPFDLTGFVIEMVVGSDRYPRVIYGSTTTGEIQPSATGFSFIFPASVLSTIRPGTYVADCRIKSALNEFTHLFTAQVSVLDGGF